MTFPLQGGGEFRILLRRSLLAVVVGTVLVMVCYFYVDRPVAFFVHSHKINSYLILKWLTYPPPILQTWAPLVLVVLMVRRAFGPFRRAELVLLAACVAIIVADQFRESLSDVAGRYWPDTWRGNPSLIQNNAYGFNLFHTGDDYGSFPSGHMARTLSLAAVLWIAYPTWRWLCVLLSVAEACALVGMDYHFVGDVIAGGVIGALVGTYTLRGVMATSAPAQPTARG